ncbi:nitroreductase family protein [Candidatus Phycosocius spiralis]|uniref:Putative NAD(P)H nitroreductase n=1 Tax=Candidatus Phycosocius spiralis TaxID=2815099 RepID=A0ABQ4PXJ8_9PROT|nr:nitroreductase [Candidatus Phycosocius spiralis]GIU67413.1 nitroreductase [Candidatus Phycosocius spiralis]
MTVTPSELPPHPKEHDDLALPVADRAFLTRLALRRSSKVIHLADPGPDKTTLEAILQIGARVPDHGKLGPWRFIVLTGTHRESLGQKLADLLESRSKDPEPAQLAAERARFLRAPLVIGVVSAPVESSKVPRWEQVLSAGAVCYNVLLTANGFGFSGCWLSEWICYDGAALALLGLASSEQLAGFIYLGTPTQPLRERARPEIGPRVTFWQP